MMMNLFTSPLWDVARAVEATTLSLMTGEKAAALSKAMGELTHVGREVYKAVNWQKYIIGETAIAMKGVVAAALSSAMGEPEHVEHGVYYAIVECATIENIIESGVYDVFKENQHVKVSLPAISTILVVYGVTMESKSVKRSAVVEDMSGVPLSLTRDSVADGSDFNDVKGEVLGKLQISLVSFLLPESKVTYGMAKQRSVSKEHSMRSGIEKKGKLDRRRSLERYRRAVSSNSCPGGVLEGIKSLQSS